MSVLYLLIIVLVRVANVAILARVLLSWIPVNRDNRLVAFIYEVTEPILGPIRRVVPPLAGLDLSPVIALVLIEMLQRALFALLARLS